MKEENIEYIDYRKNFAMMIPKEALKFKRPPLIKITSEWGYWKISIKKPSYPELLDRLLRPLCKLGGHRWKATYGYTGFKIWQYDSPDSNISDVKKEENYQCARCKKTKTVER